MKTWAAQDPGAVAITDIKKEMASRARDLQIAEDGTAIGLHFLVVIVL